MVYSVYFNSKYYGMMSASIKVNRGSAYFKYVIDIDEKEGRS